MKNYNYNNFTNDNNSLSFVISTVKATKTGKDLDKIFNMQQTTAIL